MGARQEAAWQRRRLERQLSHGGLVYVKPPPEWLLPLTLVLLTACSSQVRPDSAAPSTAPRTFPRPQGVEVVAHRGGTPENTLTAFRQALAHKGTGAIELDVQVAKDGELIVMHDLTVDRTTSGKGTVRELTASELRAMRTPRLDSLEPVPLLSEALDLMKAAEGKRVFVELKAPMPKEAVPNVIAQIRGRRLEERAIVISFDASVLDEVRKAAPELATALVANNLTDQAVNYPSPYLFLKRSAVTASAVRKVHDAGRWLYVWTVNEAPHMQEMLDLKVDGLISDTYDLAVRTRGQ